MGTSSIARPPASRAADPAKSTPASRQASPQAVVSDHKVDEASRGSFPASDAPSLTCVTGIRLRSIAS